MNPSPSPSPSPSRRLVLSSGVARLLLSPPLAVATGLVLSVAAAWFLSAPARDVVQSTAFSITVIVLAVVASETGAALTVAVHRVLTIVLFGPNAGGSPPLFVRSTRLTAQVANGLDQQPEDEDERWLVAEYGRMLSRHRDGLLTNPGWLDAVDEPVDGTTVGQVMSTRPVAFDQAQQLTRLHNAVQVRLLDLALAAGLILTGGWAMGDVSLGVLLAVGAGLAVVAAPAALALFGARLGMIETPVDPKLRELVAGDDTTGDAATGDAADVLETVDGGNFVADATLGQSALAAVSQLTVRNTVIPVVISVLMAWLVLAMVAVTTILWHGFGGGWASGLFTIGGAFTGLAVGVLLAVAVLQTVFDRLVPVVPAPVVGLIAAVGFGAGVVAAARGLAETPGGTGATVAGLGLAGMGLVGAVVFLAAWLLRSHLATPVR